MHSALTVFAYKADSSPATNYPKYRGRKQKEKPSPSRLKPLAYLRFTPPNRAGDVNFGPHPDKPGPELPTTFGTD